MIDPGIQRAQLLYQQGRYDLAADALREALAQAPQNAGAHALLGLCLVWQKQYEDATSEAQLAVHQEPDNAFGHYARGKVWLERNWFGNAEGAAREAVRLGAEDPDHWSLLAQCLFAQRRWQEALDAADRGLQLQPEHATCINLRAMALVKLGETEAASVTISGALRLNPQNALSQANQGWTLLHQNRPREALEHFREALRLDPNNAWAREGTLEALNARHLIYRIMLRYYLWMSRFTRRGQWGVILGFWVAMQILRAVEAARPELAVVIYPLLGAYVVFALATWLATPVFNLTLLVNPFGRYLLTCTQAAGAVVVGLLLLAGAVLFPLGVMLPSAVLAIGGLLAFALTLPSAAAARCRAGLPLILMVCYTVGVFGLGLAGIVLLVLRDDSGVDYLIGALWGSVLSSLAANVLLMMIPKK